MTFKPCFEEWVGFGHVEMEIGQIVCRERSFRARTRVIRRVEGKSWARESQHQMVKKP